MSSFVIVRAELKLTEQAPLRITAELNERLEKACDKLGERRPQFIRRAIVQELDRVEAIQPALDAPTRARLEKLRVLEELAVDVDAELERLLQAAGQPAA
jgi:predicted DNA-binding protein